jgi:hypothetical protein
MAEQIAGALKTKKLDEFLKVLVELGGSIQ